MNNGSFLVQLTGKLIFAYVKSLVTVILLVPHCRYINLQWGMILFDGSTTEKNITLPINFSIILGFSTFAYGQGVHSVFGGYHQPPNGISMYRKSFFAENVNCIWLGVFK